MSLSKAWIAAGVTGRYLAGFGSRPRESRTFVGSVLRYIATYDPAAALDPSHLPVRPVHEVFPGIADNVICMRHIVEPWSLPYGEAYLLAAISAHMKPRQAFEIGTFTGGATMLIAEKSPAHCTVHTLDLPEECGELKLAGTRGAGEPRGGVRIGERFIGQPIASRIVQHFGDSASFDFEPFTGAIDLVFIDGSHSYDYVRNDTARALRMLSPTGAIVWDDCSPNFPGVIRALDEFGAARPIYRILGSRFAIHTPRA